MTTELKMEGHQPALVLMAIQDLRLKMTEAARSADLDDSGRETLRRQVSELTAVHARLAEAMSTPSDGEPDIFAPFAE